MDVTTLKVMTSMSSEIFDELETVKEAARHLRKHPRTLMRWTRLPDGLPFVRLGQVPYLHIPTAKAWIESRIHRPNPVRAARRKQRHQDLAVTPCP